MRNSRIRLAASSIAALLFLSSASASAQARVRGVARLGLEYGGDKVAQFEYSDGTTPDVTAGGGLLLTGGAVGTLFSRMGHAVDAQLNVGLKYRTIPPATNQEVTWLRFPVEGLLYYRTPIGLRLGAGGAVHLHNVISSSGEVLNERVSFKNKPGLLLQAEYVRGIAAFDLRYTAMEYEVQEGGVGTVNASSLGLGVSFFFGKK